METSYRIHSNVQVLDNPERRYVITIRDLPDDEKPRERLQAAGPRGLTAAELLAVVFGNGTKKEGVLEMANRIMSEYGERSIMRQSNPEKLAKDLDIPFKYLDAIEHDNFSDLPDDRPIAPAIVK